MNKNNIPDNMELIRAAQYVRMSTEHQQYSTANQRDMIKEFAATNGMKIVKTYADDGKSGLNIDGRDSLKQLIHDVENGNIDFQIILVYDISRWGRFQDADESAYYEHICKRSGINVLYCAEQFKNDGSPGSTIIKSVKRAMAGEYSRELSVKVFKGQCRLIKQGFRQGGPAGFGLRRMLLDQSGKQKGLLSRGEYKSIQTDRVILVPGPMKEREIVEEIYNLFVEKGKSEFEIASLLNNRGVKTDLNRQWTRGAVNQILSNEKYIGNNVYNRCSFKLKKRRVKNPETLWIRNDGAFEGIINPQVFYKAQGIIMERSRKFSDEEMLDRLKSLFQKHGKLSGFLIDESEGMPSSIAYKARFKGLIRAYRLVGYTPDRDYQYIQINQRLRRMHPEVILGTIQKIENLGGHVKRDEETDLLFINDQFTTSIVLSRCRQTPTGSLRWVVRFDTSLEPDLTIVLRMDAVNEKPVDYYLLPFVDISFAKLHLAENNRLDFDAYRFDSLDFFFGMAEQVKIKLAI